MNRQAEPNGSGAIEPTRTEAATPGPVDAPVNNPASSEEEKLILVNDAPAAATSPPETTGPLLSMDKPDPMKWVKRLRQLCQELEAAHMEKTQLLLGQMRSTLNDLELALKQRKQGGRPKGKRHKVKDAHIEAIRRWEKGDGSEYPVGSVTDLADALNLSRQTVYTILAEIRSDSAPAQPDVVLNTPG